MRCPKCSMNVSKRAGACPLCGTQFTYKGKEAAAAATKKKNKKGFPVFLLFLPIGVILIFVGVYMSISYDRGYAPEAELSPQVAEVEELAPEELPQIEASQEIPVEATAEPVPAPEEKASEEAAEQETEELEFPDDYLVIPGDLGAEVSLTAENLQGEWKTVLKFHGSDPRFYTLMTLIFDGDVLTKRWYSADGSYQQWVGPWRFVNENTIIMTSTTYTEYSPYTDTAEVRTWGETYFSPFYALYENAIFTTDGLDDLYIYRQ